MGLRTLTPVGESLSVNQLVFSLWSFPPRRYGIFYIMKSPHLPLDAAFSFSSGVGYLFYGFRPIRVEIVQLLVVNFVVFRREVELQFFYSAFLERRSASLRNQT